MDLSRRKIPGQSSTTATSSQRQRKRNMTKRTLTFSRSVSVKLIPTFCEMTDAEYFDTYYTDVEFQQLRESTMDDVRELRYLYSLQKDNQDNAAQTTFLCNTASASTFCHRGIEHLRSVETNQHRRQTRRSYVRAILAEQDIQYDAGYHDPAALGRVASNLSSPSRVEAIRKADADAAEARRVAGMTGKMARALLALHDAEEDPTASKDGETAKPKAGNKLDAIRSARRPLGLVRRRSYRQTAAVA